MCPVILSWSWAENSELSNNARVFITYVPADGLPFYTITSTIDMIIHFSFVLSLVSEVIA